MKSLYLFIICSLVFIYTALGQTTDEKVASKITELHQKGITSIILYQAYCTGIFYRKPDTVNCFPAPDDIKYILWEEEGRNYIQRIDRCYSYMPIKGKSVAILKLLADDFEKIRKEVIKPVEYFDPKDRKLKLMDGGDHGCYADIDIYTASKNISKHINYFDLYTQFADNDFIPQVKRPRNINYAYNQHTYLKKLKDTLEKEVAELKFTKVN